MSDYPDGKLNNEDEGAIEIGLRVDVEKKVVVVNFFKPLSWLAFDKASAYALAEELVKKASLL